MRMTDETCHSAVAAPFNPLTIFVPIWAGPKAERVAKSVQSTSSQRVLRRVISDSGAELQQTSNLGGERALSRRQFFRPISKFVIQR